MNRVRVFVFTILAIMILSVFAGCSLPKALEDEQLRSYTDEMLTHILDDDFDSAYILVSDAYKKDEFAKEFTDMQLTLYGVEDYELKLMSFKRNSTIKNGVTLSRVDSVYKMVTEVDTYVVTVARDSDHNKLSFFTIKNHKETKLYKISTLTNIKNSTPLQWVILLLSIPVYIVTIYAIVDCCRSNTKRKVLWIIIILLGFVVISKTLGSEGLRSNINLGLFFNTSSLTYYGDGSLALYFSIPIGAIVYMCMRKQLKQKDDSANEEENGKKIEPPQYYNNQ